MCSVYESKARDYLEQHISSNRKSSKEEAEGVEPLLVLHARESMDYKLLIGVLNTKTSLHYSGCGYTSGFVSQEFQEPKIVPMDIKERAETQGDKPEGVSPKGTHVDPLPSGEGLKYVGEMSSAEITEELEKGTLAAAKAPSLVSGYTGTKECT